ncbi:MAG: cytochrome c biogenesis protein CcsA [Deltaproteobacteria bacterium]|nr:cytochrome c biogenesis protein CcsA [Deltaproteobacteria bacterium]
MSEFLFSVAAAGYAVASVLWLVYLRGRSDQAMLRAPWVLSVGVVAHVAHESTRWMAHGVRPVDGIGPMLSMLALLVTATVLLFWRIGRRLEVVGAFALPVAFALLLGSRVGPEGTASRGAMFVVHVAANSVGVAAAMIASAAAMGYLLLERQVKARRLGAMFRRLPPLETLESLSARSVLVALPALTLGIVTGHIVAARAHRAAGLPWQQLFAMGTWVVFVILALLRWAGRVRGRRAMVATLSGGLALAFTLAIYLGRVRP